MKIINKSLIAAITFSILPSLTQATIITFSDKATFLASTASTSATGVLPDLGLVGSTVTLGDITFSQASPGGEIWVGADGNAGVPGGDWSSTLPGNDIAINGIENLNADLSSSVFAFGFDFLEPSVGRDISAGIIDGTCFVPVCTDSTFSVTLFDGVASIGSFTFNAPDDLLSFVGVSSDVAFDRVEIRDLTATIDDEFFGEFFTASTPFSVPEPSVVWLLGLGLLGLVGIRKKRDKTHLIFVNK